MIYEWVAVAKYGCTCECFVVVQSIDFNLANIFVCFHLFGQQLETFSGKNCLPLTKRVRYFFLVSSCQLGQVYLHTNKFQHEI